MTKKKVKKTTMHVPTNQVSIPKPKRQSVLSLKIKPNRHLEFIMPAGIIKLSIL